MSRNKKNEKRFDGFEVLTRAYEVALAIAENEDMSTATCLSASQMIIENPPYIKYDPDSSIYPLER